MGINKKAVTEADREIKRWETQGIIRESSPSVYALIRPRNRIRETPEYLKMEKQAKIAAISNYNRIRLSKDPNAKRNHKLYMRKWRADKKKAKQEARIQ